jgi:thiol-disulfide isomerase/thioredoxin
MADNQSKLPFQRVQRLLTDGVAALSILVIGSGCCVWVAAASALADRGVVGFSAVQAGQDKAGVAAEPRPHAPAVAARLTGIVKLDETDEPIAGARLQISIGFVLGAGSRDERVVETDADGRFTVDLPQGNTRVWLSDPPPGYLVLSAQESMEDIDVRPDQPIIHREYHVRKGTVWTLQFTRGSKQTPFPGFVTAVPSIFSPRVPTQAQADDRGIGLLTLPTEGRTVELGIMETSPRSSAGVRTGSIRATLDWDPGFRPDDVREISRLAGNERGFRMIDGEGRTAVLRAHEPIDAVKADAKLVIRVPVRYRDAKDYAALTGQVLNDQGHPLAGARVSLAPPGISAEPDVFGHSATTDPRGHYRLRDIPRRAMDGSPIVVRLSVTKEGYAGIQAPVSLAEGDADRPQVVDPIRLEPGVSLSGVVLDHRGRVVPGARVQSLQRSLRVSSAGPPHATKTDENGRFTIPGLRRGVTMLYAFHEKVRASNFYLADGSPEAVRIKLPARMDAPAANPGAGPEEPLAVGAPAPEWKVGPWSDRLARKLADERGKVVVLYFWGMPFLQSVSVLPALGKVAAEFRPQNVEFLAIHSVEPDEETAREQGRRVLAFQGAPLAMAVDDAGLPGHPRGATGTLYGIGALPVLIVIDRAGKIAFRSDISGPGNLIAVFREMVHSPKDMSEQQASEIVRRTLAEEITKALKR